MIIKPLIKVKVNIFDITKILNLLKETNIKIYNLKQIDTYIYTFDILYYQKKKLNIVFENYEILSCKGFVYNLFSLLKYKTTLIALIISIASYISVSSRIWSVNITGDATSLIPFVEEKLKENNIKVGCKKFDVNELSIIQNKVLYSNFDTIEYLSIKSSGSVINVSFKKKRNETQINKFKGNLYASKDGLIKSFDLLSGEKVVDINKYVKKGDLLVKDVLTTDYNQEIYIGTFGSVYAYTWYYSTISLPINEFDSDETILANALINSKQQISANFTNNEYIYEENVLQFIKQDNNVFIKIHFTCVEDIAKE